MDSRLNDFTKCIHLSVSPCIPIPIGVLEETVSAPADAAERRSGYNDDATIATSAYRSTRSTGDKRAASGSDR
jgi:hypothetical protein